MDMEPKMVTECDCDKKGDFTLTPDKFAVSEVGNVTSVCYDEYFMGFKDPYDDFSHVILMTGVKFPERFLRFDFELNGVPP
jgi:hypothetical protein